MPVWIVEDPLWVWALQFQKQYRSARVHHHPTLGDREVKQHETCTDVYMQIHGLRSQVGGVLNYAQLPIDLTAFGPTLARSVLRRVFPKPTHPVCCEHIPSIPWIVSEACCRAVVCHAMDSRASMALSRLSTYTSIFTLLQR